MLLVLIGFGLVALLAFVIVYNIAKPDTKARAEAARLGLTVGKVMREVPTYAGRGAPMRLERLRVTRYSLARSGPARGVRWQLLQRQGTDPESRDLPSGWRIVVTEGTMPGMLRDALVRITKASPWQEEYLELEGDAAGVYAYWEEQGGARLAKKVHQHLTEIATAGG